MTATDDVVDPAPRRRARPLPARAAARLRREARDSATRAYKSVHDPLARRLPSLRRSGLIIEHMEIDLVLSRVPHGKPVVALDIGAHHGELLDILELHPEGRRGTVVCVEPEATNIAVLRRRRPWYRRLDVEICPYAVSNAPGRRTFYTASETTLFTTTPEWKRHFPDHFSQSREVEVTCLTVTEIAAHSALLKDGHVDLVKIDTEGHDVAVITSLLDSPLVADAVMFEAGLDDAETARGCALLAEAGHQELYLFARTGIPTTFVGEWAGEGHLADLRRQGRFDCGNVVAFWRGA